jgi:hypothetical protein
VHPTHLDPTIDSTTILAGITPADVLRGAALYLDRHGWHQGAYYPEHRDTPFPPACAIGAIRMAVCGQPVTFAENLARPEWLLIRAACMLLAEYLDGDYNPADEDGDALDAIGVIGAFNDDDSRTRAEVQHTLREAAYFFAVRHRRDGAR